MQTYEPKQTLVEPREADAVAARVPSNMSRALAPRVSVVIAALNEAECLPAVLARIPDDIFEVILVDGHSTDSTIETTERVRPDTRIIVQPGRGKGDALRAAFAVVRGDVIVVIDADGSTDPCEIPAFVTALVAGGDFAKGSRFLPGAGTADMTFIRKVATQAFLILTVILFRKRFTDINYGFNAFWTQLLPALELRSDGFEIECEMLLGAIAANLNIVEVPSFERARIGGKAHLRPIPDGLRILAEMLRRAVRSEPRSPRQSEELS